MIQAAPTRQILNLEEERKLETIEECDSGSDAEIQI